VIRRVVVVVVLTVASFTLAACGSISASTAMSNWTKSSSFSSAVAQLTLDARHALSELDVVSATPAQLHTVCAVLDLETLQANSALPTPDDQTTALISKAYTDLGDGANECYVASGSFAKRDRAIAYIRRAGAELSEAQARVEALRG
jgi:hypothetical protein